MYRHVAYTVICQENYNWKVSKLLLQCGDTQSRTQQQNDSRFSWVTLYLNPKYRLREIYSGLQMHKEVHFKPKWSKTLSRQFHLKLFRGRRERDIQEKSLALHLVEKMKFTQLTFTIVKIEAVWQYCIKRVWTLQSDMFFVRIPFSLSLVAVQAWVRGIILSLRKL